MTGSPCSNSGTQARHPNLLQQQGCRDNRLSDKLRRMAIKNAYESRSVCGASGIELDTEPSEKSSAGKVLPAVANNKPSSSNPHRYSSRSKRPAQKTLSSPIPSSRARSAAAVASGTGSSKMKSPSTVHDVGASAGDDPELVHHHDRETTKQTALVQQKSDVTTNTDSADDSSTTSTVPAHLRRSTSHSSVAVNSTASSSLSQPMGESSSYIYHIPGRMISRGRSRSQSRVHAHMHTHNIPTLSLKRSSSHSTVALHRTNHCPVPLSHNVPSGAPHHSAMTTSLNYSNGVGPEPLYDHDPYHYHHSGAVYGAGGGSSYSRSLSQDHYGGMATTQSAYATRHNKVYEPWTSDIGLIESQFPRMFKHIEHTAPTGRPSSSGSRKRRNKPTDFPPIQGNSQPDSLHYGMPPPSSSSYRHKYHPSAASHPHSWVGETDNPGVSPTTHFGSSSQFQRSPPGITPHLVTAHPSPPHSHHHHHSRAVAPVDSVRRKRVTLHPPRGKKVASLV